MKLSSLASSSSAQLKAVMPIRFVVLFGVQVMGFQKVSGLGRQFDVEWVNEGGVNDHPILLPGQQKAPFQLRFSRGVCLRTVSTESFSAPGSMVANNFGPMGRLSNVGTILVLDRNGAVAAIYAFLSRGVLEWTVDDLDAQGGGPLIETFTVAHDGLRNYPVPQEPPEPTEPAQKKTEEEKK